MDTTKLDLAAYMSGSISRIMAKAYKSNLHCKGCYARSNGIADERCARLQRRLHRVGQRWLATLLRLSAEGGTTHENS